MFRRQARKDWIVLLSSQTDKVFAAPCQGQKGRMRIGALREIEDPGKIRCNTCYILLHSPQTFILKDYFPVAKSDVLTMMLDERIRVEGFLGADVAFIHTFKKLSTAGKRQQLLVISQPALLLERAMNILDSMQARRVECITSVPAAVAAMMNAIVDEPVIAVLIRNNACEYLLCKDGIPEIMQVAPLDTSSSQVSSMLLQGLNAVVHRASSSLGVKVKNVILMGHGVDYSTVVSQGFQVLKPDFSRFFQADNPGDLLNYPELGGVLYAGPDLDFMPRSWRVCYSFEKFIDIGLVVAGLASALLIFGGYRVDGELKALQARYMEQYRKLAAMTERIEAMLPGSRETALMESLAALQKRSLEEPRIDDVLLSVAGCLPETVHIDSFRAERQNRPTKPVAGQGMANPARPSQAGMSGNANPASIAGSVSGELVFHVSFASEGEFYRIKTRFEHVLEKMVGVFRVSGMRWWYDEAGATGKMQCDLRLLESGGEA